MIDLIEIGLLIYIIYYLNQIVKTISNQDDYIYNMFSELSKGIFTALKKYDRRWKK
ncbi:hypothetical protein SuUB15_11190 [Streptococcus uberis]